MQRVIHHLPCLMLALLLLAAMPVARALEVRVSAPSGAQTQVLPEGGGEFAVNLPLSRNAVNRITVEARDAQGRSASRELAITQISLDQLVVTRVITTPLPPERVQQLVNEGVIDLENPENFNVSQFDIVLTIGGRPMPISVPIAIPLAEAPQGYEEIPPLSDPGNGSGNPPPAPVQVVVFQVQPTGPPGINPPPIPGIILIEGKIKSLKEFFSVRLLMLNISGIFTLDDLQAEISFPDGGLSATLPADGVATLNAIAPGNGDEPGQAEREFIIRGDEIGVRKVKVAFSGNVRGPGLPEDAPIPFSGSAIAEVEVKGPPSFLVQVTHPDYVYQNQPYELLVDITNTGEVPALYASLELEVGADAELIECTLDPETNETECGPIEGPAVRTMGHLQPGQTATLSFTINPLATGPITSCMGLADQNITLQVAVGDEGCLVGHFPPERGVNPGIPSVAVLPQPNQTGVDLDAPVAAFFSRKMASSTITTGASGTFRVFDPENNVVPGVLRFEDLGDGTVAIFQVLDNITNRWTPDTRYTVRISPEVRDTEGNGLASEWVSEFKTTNPFDDRDAPELTLGILPPVDPNAVLPGQLVRVNAYAADQGSGIGRIELRSRPLGVEGALYTLVDQKTIQPGEPASPCIFTVDSSLLEAGRSYQLKGTAYDRAGNIREATLAIVVSPAANPPTITLPAAPAAPVQQGISIDITPLAVSAGVRTIEFFLDDATQPFASSTLAPWQSIVPTLGLTLGDHVVRARAIDGLGQTGEDTLAFTLIADPSKPTVTLIGATDGARLVRGERLTLRGEATDTYGISSLRFYLDSVGGTPIAEGSDPFQVDTTTLTQGLHRVIGVAVNLLGNASDATANAAVLDFEVIEPAAPGGTPPPAPQLGSIAPPDASGLVSFMGSTVPQARVDVQNVTQGFAITLYADGAGAFSGSIQGAAGDVLRFSAIDPAQSPNAGPFLQVTVAAAPVLTGITVVPPQLNFTSLGAFADLTVVGSFSNGTSATLTSGLTFSSSAPGVASVGSNGRVAAQANGNAVITVAAGALQATVAVGVQAVTLTELVITPPSLAFTFIGQQTGLQVAGRYSDGTVQALGGAFSFATANPDVATVTPAGVVEARGAGSTTIIVTRLGLAPAIVAVEVDTSTSAPPTATLLDPADGAGVEPGEVVTIRVRAQGVTPVNSIAVQASGAATLNETRPIAPASNDTTQVFTLPIPSQAAVGGTIDISAMAGDTGGLISAPVTATLTIVDRTSPTVSITSPTPTTPYNFGDDLNVGIAANDLVGVTEVRLLTSGAFVSDVTRPVDPARQDTALTITLPVPFGLTNPDLRLTAFARDAAGNEGRSAVVEVLLTDADITPPATTATLSSNPGTAPTTVITYQVTEGLADLDHVELYFRRNGLGTFNRYTVPQSGNPDGHFTPQSGATGTILFDSTRMGGDGAYEFYTVGVDRAGNREAAPRDAAQVPVGDVARTINNSPPVVVITQDSEISTSSFDNQNLRISGATVTVVGAHAFHNVELVNGARLVHRETTATDEYRLTLNVWTLTVDATSAIDLDGRGYIGGASYNAPGLTAGNQPGAAAGAGGSYGGLGGSYSGGIPNPVYGSLIDPQFPGSGGGNWFGAAVGGDGGGLLVLTAINAVVDGSLRANGRPSGGSASGNGSGGALNLNVATLSGRGTLEANAPAGGGGVGAGGGRIAARYRDLSTYDTGLISARGGTGPYGTTGANGTVYLQQADASAGDLIIEGQGPNTPFTSLEIPAGFTFDSITLRNNARVTTNDPISITGRLWLTGNSILTHGNGLEAGLSITARDVLVDAGSAIDVSGRGYAGSTAYYGPGVTLGGQTGAAAGVGGSHGGFGASWPVTPPSPVYGDFTAADTLGGGGGDWAGTAGGAGGGRLTIIASQQVRVEGALRADGGESAGSAAGDGAGGSIRIETSRLFGAGTISAGAPRTGSGTAGGGGRIAIYAEYIDPEYDFADLRQVVALGGTGQYAQPGLLSASGTVFVQLAGQGRGDLIVDNGTPAATASRLTQLQSIGRGVTQAVTANSLQLDGTLPQLPGALVGLRLNPDRNQSQTFLIVANTTDTITVATPNELGSQFAGLAGVGKLYGGAYRVGNLILRGGGALELGDPLTADGQVLLTENSLLTHLESTDRFTSRLELATDDLIVSATARIDATGRGYLGGRDYYGPGLTVGNLPGSVAGTGGSHGGMGSTYQGSAPAAQHGSLTQSDELGGGGGNWAGTNGGDGGGLLLIHAATAHIDGAVRSNGEPAGSAAGGGAGGGIHLDVGLLTGLGTLEANGGGSGTGGGGGRISLDLDTPFSFPSANVRVLGAQGNYGGRAGNGTLFIRTPSLPQGELILDAHGVTAATDLTFIPNDFTFDRVTLRNGARATLPSGLRVAQTLALLNGSQLTHPPQSEPGMLLEVDTLQVDATSAIQLSGRGYRGGLANGEAGRTLGNLPGSPQGSAGSHGGLGSNYDGTRPTPSYGDLRLPRALGSGGSNWSGAAGAAGGGRLEVFARVMQLDGQLLANGGSAGSAAGNGAGGSILLQVETLSGTGLVQANGGGGTGTGGGGGRVAVLASTEPTLPEDNLRATGGQGNYGTRAGDGTVYIATNHEPQGHLILNAFGASPAIDRTFLEDAAPFGRVSLRANARLTADLPVNVLGSLLLTGSSAITHTAGDADGLRINAATLFIEAGSSLDASGRGYPGGSGNYDSGMTLEGQVGSINGTGGSHGGIGAGYQGRIASAVYGDPRQPIALGSGGGAWAGFAGGTGGGRIDLDISTSLTVQGAILANGTSAGSAAGNGAGGSIRIHAPLIAGTGSITANGGGGTGTGGGGGRVAIHTSGFLPGADFDGARNVAAIAGRGSYDNIPAAAGTVYVAVGSQDTLYIDDNRVAQNAARPTLLPAIGMGFVQAIAGNTLRLTPAAAFLPGGLVGARINPNVEQFSGTFTVVANTTDTVTLASPNAQGQTLAGVVTLGSAYAGVDDYDNLTLRRGGSLEQGNLLRVSDALRITDYSRITHQPSSTTYEALLDIEAGLALVDATSSINVTGCGYLGGQANNESGRTLGQASGSTAGAGGSYGGLGGIYSGGVPNALYGSANDPVELGSGGGNWSGNVGGAGGGRVLLRAEQLDLQGSIAADGAAGAGSAAGGGSGGTINVDVSTLLGSGQMRANGSGNGVSGGGGRIAIRHTGGALGISALASPGPASYGTTGGAGTVVINPAAGDQANPANQRASLLLVIDQMRQGASSVQPDWLLYP